MEFSSIYEEEKKFPCQNISYEEGRVIRYLIMNMEIFKNGEVITMSLNKMQKYIYGNGLFWDKDGCNQTFEAFIKKRKNNYEIIVDSQEVISKKRHECLKKFIFDKDDIKVFGKIEEESLKRN